jgi:tetratricopeptide (TPR) repeat protein
MTGGVTATGRGRIGRRMAAALALLALAAAPAAWLWWGNRGAGPAGPPEIALEAADPEAAAAVTAARGEVLREPKSATAWGVLGEVLLANQFPAEADVCLARAEALDSAAPRWSYLRAWGLLPRDRDAGLEALRRAVERSDHADEVDVMPRLLLAEIYMEQDDRDQVEALCRRVLEREPDNGRAHFDLGMIALTHNDMENCIPHLLRAAESPYARQRAYTQLATAYQRQGDATAAADCARRARQAPPDLPVRDLYIDEMDSLKVGRTARNQQVERLEAQGRLPEAAGLLRQAADAYHDERSYVRLGVALTKLGDFAEAERALRAASAAAPRSSDACYYLSVALYKEGESLQRAGDGDSSSARFLAAADAARRATQLKPDHALAHLYLGYSLKRLGRRAEAIDSFRTALRCRPEIPGIELALGEALAEDGKQDEAVAHLQLACDLADPGDSLPRETLARVRGAHKP